MTNQVQERIHGITHFFWRLGIICGLGYGKHEIEQEGPAPHREAHEAKHRSAKRAEDVHQEDPICGEDHRSSGFPRSVGQGYQGSGQGCTKRRHPQEPSCSPKVANREASSGSGKGLSSRSFQLHNPNNEASRSLIEGLFALVRLMPELDCIFTGGNRSFSIALP